MPTHEETFRHLCDQVDGSPDDGAALADLGEAFVLGNGTAPNFSQGLAFYAKAAEFGNSKAMTNFGFLMIRGLVPRADYPGASVARGRALVEQAAANNFAFAHFVLGSIEEEGLPSSKTPGAPNYAAAAMHYERAVELASPHAQWALGNMHLHGRGVTKNATTAMQYFQAAALSKLPFTLGSLAECFDGSLPGVDADPTRAHELHAEAAALGWPPSIRAMGAALEREGKINEALALYRTGANLGNPDSFHELGRCARFGLGQKKNLSDAARLCRTAFSMGRTECQVCLHEMNVERDRTSLSSCTLQ